MTIKTVDPATDAILIHRLGKDEMNFAEFPIALLTDRVPKGQRSIKFEDQIFDPKRKKKITRRRIIDGSEEYGLPTATDDAVILALIQLTKQYSDFERREVEFTRLELIKLLGWADEGRNFDRLKLSLIRIANVTYNYENAWWDNRQKTWVTKVFHILDTVEINDSRVSAQQKCLFPSRIVWNEVVFDSFQASFLRDIDFQLCIQLEHPIALRMYRFLGKRFHVEPDWSFDLKEFAHDHMGLGKNYEGGTQIARKLRPAIGELEKLDFLQLLSEADRFRKRGREWTVRFVRKAADALILPKPESAGLTVPTSSLVNQLIDRGVTAKTAADLVANKPAEAIVSRLEVFDWLKDQKQSGFNKSPAGFLVASIRDEYAPPQSFIPLAELQRRNAAKRAKEQETANAKLLKQQQEMQERADRKAINAYRDALSPATLTQMENDAIAQSSQAIQDNLSATTDPAFRRFVIGTITDDYIRQILRHPLLDA